MPPIKAKLVTIITDHSARKRVVEALLALGARGYSLSDVDGFGVHGHHAGGIFESKNLAFMVVAPEALALKIFAWVEAELLLHFPAIAYASEVEAMPADHF